MSGETIGIIYPPPELRNIVDKTASFVARNGPEFESRIQQNEQNNPKFNFLKQGDPYNGYYQHKVKDFRDGGGKGNDITAPPSATTPASQPPSSQLSSKSVKQLESLVEAPIIIRDPPPDFEFSIDPPSISALDLDIVKLTAQFVAIHGRSFLTNLMNREQRNYQFDFLRPQHGLFSYFTQLIEQYTKVLMPPKTIVSDLRKEVDNQKAVIEKIRYRLEWTKIQEAERRREEEEAERERMQYAQIDWHDFVLVETVDYQPHESGMFPPPTTPEQVGSRILLQARIEEQGQADVEMDVESDEEDGGKKSDDKQKQAMPPPPLPPQLDNVLIRKDYNPKAVKSAQPVAAPSKEAWVISPITGEKVPADKLQEHMRFALLDPRWVEERERTIQAKMNQEEVYAPGTSIESSLKHLAERRTDIFGSGDVETAIGQKIGEEERQRKPEKPTWDGYSTSADAVSRAARANITIEEQIQQIHKMKGLVQENEKDRIGPASTPVHSMQGPTGGYNNPMTSLPRPPMHHQQQQQHHQQQHHHQPSMSMMNTAMQHGGQGMGMPPHGMPPGPPMMPGPGGQPFMMTPQSMMMAGMYGGMMPPDMSGLHAMGQGGMPPGFPLPVAEEEPASKKQKTEDNLIPEEEFIEQNPAPVTVQVIVPQVADKPEWQLNGQTFTLTMPLTDTFGGVKNKIQEELGMPIGKQKLQYEGMFVKDSNTLGFYNVPSGSTILLGLKERGGRKK